MQMPVDKKTVLHEVRAIFAIILYLACCLCVLATMKSLVLIQQGINDFVPGYEEGVVFAVILGKVVALAQRLPILDAFNRRPLVWSVLYKSLIMTAIVSVFVRVEHLIFPHQHDQAPIHPIIFMVAHQLGLIFIFSVLFMVRGLDEALGPGRLRRLFFEPRKNSASGDTNPTGAGSS